MAFRLEHVHVKTAKPQETAKFYLDALGATLVEATHGNTRFRVDLHGVTLNITDHIPGQTREQRYGLEHFALETDRFDEVMANLKAQGATVMEQLVLPMPDHPGKRLGFVEGPEGVQIELIEVKAFSG